MLDVVTLQDEREITNMDNVVRTNEVLRHVRFDVPVTKRHVRREPLRRRCGMERDVQPVQMHGFGKPVPQVGEPDTAWM